MKKLKCITPIIQEVHGEDLEKENERLKKGLPLSDFWDKRLRQGDVEWVKQSNTATQTKVKTETKDKGEK